MPATNAPNTGWTPIRSVAAAHRNVVTITSTRSESLALKCSVATRTATRRTGYRTKIATRMKIAR